MVGHLLKTTLSAGGVETPENHVLKKEEFYPTSEGLPEFEGSPNPEESNGSKRNIVECACPGRVGLGREFYDMMVQATEGG